MRCAQIGRVILSTRAMAAWQKCVQTSARSTRVLSLSPALFALLALQLSSARHLSINPKQLCLSSMVQVGENDWCSAKGQNRPFE